MDKPCGFKVGDRCELHGNTGQLLVSEGAAVGDRYVVFASDHGLAQVFNRAAAAVVKPLEIINA